jgi:putative salt-induced outer membrane protein YdiY
MMRRCAASRVARLVVMPAIVCLGLVPGVAAQTPSAPPPPPAAPPPPPPPPPPPLREGSIDFAYVGTSGNSDTQTIGLGGEYVYRPAPWETRLKVKFVRNESDDVLQANSFLLTFRVQRALTPTLSAYGAYAYERDRFAGIVNRNAVEGGLSYTWVDVPRHLFTVDGGLGYAHESRVTGPDLSTATLSAGARYTFRISDTSELGDEIRCVQSLADGDDWRCANTLSVTAKLTSLLSLKASHGVRYLHQPADGFETTDTTTSLALVAKF